LTGGDEVTPDNIAQSKQSVAAHSMDGQIAKLVTPKTYRARILGVTRCDHNNSGEENVAENLKRGVLRPLQ